MAEKWYLRLRSLSCFTSLLLTRENELPWLGCSYPSSIFFFEKFKCFHKICMLHSNFTFSSLDLYVFIWYCTSVCNKKYHCIPECLARCKVLIFVNMLEVQKSPSREEFLGKGVPKICGKLTGEHHAEVWFQ